MFTIALPVVLFIKTIFYPDLKQKKTQRSIKFQGVSIWNKIDLEIRKLQHKKICNTIAKILLKKKHTNTCLLLQQLVL